MSWIDFSIVSHGHGLQVLEALDSIAVQEGLILKHVRVVVTVNVAEPYLQKQMSQKQWPFELHIIQNPKPLGFGANHNRAMTYLRRLGDVKWFCVMNPDVLWSASAAGFWTSLKSDALMPSDGLVCPKQVNEHGADQDYTRELPTPWGLALRTVRRMKNLAATNKVLLSNQADWVNGACMVWRSDAFVALGGFDERFFLYCEDTDICLRMRLAGYRMTEANATVVHLAQRNSGKKWRHLAWHLQSLIRLWCSASFWKYLWRFKISQ